MLTWRQIQELYAPDVVMFWERAAAVGLECPLDVFEQLFFDHHDDADFAGVVRIIDWQAVHWEEADFSGVALRRVSIPRPYRHAVDEARVRTAEDGIQDERPEVVEHWHSALSWVRSPIFVSGEVTGTSVDAQCLVGFTRLGNLLGLLDRRGIPEAAHHRVW
ncbi:MAG TPA: hypothetical protein VN859_05070, partial [Steroidobacteraceae bacterium]|nr:hypothetical protein [Steroidobacteraceae bacterium]